MCGEENECAGVLKKKKKTGLKHEDWEPRFSILCDDFPDAALEFYFELIKLTSSPPQSCHGYTMPFNTERRKRATKRGSQNALVTTLATNIISRSFWN